MTLQSSPGQMPGAIFYCIRQKFVKNNIDNYTHSHTTLNSENPDFMRVLPPFKIPIYIIFYLCYKNTKSLTIRVVEAFLLNRQKNSSKILRKNFLDVPGSSCAHLITVMHVSAEDRFGIITQKRSHGTNIYATGQ